MWRKWPFNKVVRSHEALFLGLLIGVIVGVLMMMMVNIPVKYDNWKVPATLCGSEKNVESASFSYTGKIQKVVCKDKQVFKNF